MVDFWIDVTHLLPPLSGRRALVTGITGQDGSYLCELLLAKGYEVFGIVRRTSVLSRPRIDHILAVDSLAERVHLLYGDMCDADSLHEAVRRSMPHEVYNLAAQSHVGVSFQQPSYTGDVVGLGALRLLEAVRQVAPDARVYQASSSELFGRVRETPQTEHTPFYPRSPYAAAKAYAFWVAVNYREAYGMYVTNGILHNHESPRRGENFVTRKTTLGAVRLAAGQGGPLRLGNLDARRDWGFAGDYVEAMWLMLQAPEAEDYVIATGETHSVRELCELAFARVGLPLQWTGSGPEEKGLGPDGQVLVEVDARHLRPTEVDLLLGDASKARTKLGWQPRVSFAELVNMMVDADVGLNTGVRG